MASEFAGSWCSAVFRPVRSFSSESLFQVRQAARLYALYQAALEQAAQSTGTHKDTLQSAVRKYHPRWVCANLSPGFPKKLGLK
jgi:hypothetical protein